jgi:SAM-dependent methyltransferase
LDRAVESAGVDPAQHEERHRHADEDDVFHLLTLHSIGRATERASEPRHYPSSPEVAHCRLQGDAVPGLQRAVEARPLRTDPSSAREGVTLACEKSAATTKASAPFLPLSATSMALLDRTQHAAGSSRRASLVLLVAASATLASCTTRRHPGPNDAYQDPRVSAAVWNHYFEDDGRGEIYQQRRAIVKLAAAKPGMRVADVGAGTGLFSMLLSDAVGPDGVVYAEEVVDRFSHYIAERAERERRTNVVSVQGTETGIGLPPGSIDLAFLCDVYHHFEQPTPMLASIRRALREGGELLLVDFIREPGRSPAWVFEHVRASEAAVTREIEAAGFTRVAADHDFHDSYALRFRRAEAR